MTKIARMKALVEQFTQARNNVYAAQMVEWDAAANPFQAWDGWMSKANVAARKKANAALAQQESIYDAMK